MMRRILTFPLATLLSAAFLIGCQGAIPTLPEEPVAESSVRPGINEPFLEEALDVKEWVDRFEVESREIYSNRYQIRDAVGLRPGDAVGDIGAGTGLFVPLLSEAVGSAGKVYAVDIVPAFLDHIRERVGAAGLTNVELVLATETSVELPEASLDVAFLCDVYHHFEYPQQSLASIQRALRAGGQLFLIDFKRIPGVSSDWVMTHIRAGQEVFVEEIEAAGFELVEELELLTENYVLRFRKKTDS